MEIVSESSLFVEKYRPKTVKDLILPEDTIKFFNKMVSEGEITNLLFSGAAGKGKTSGAFALANDLKADVLFINASLESSIDTVRYKVSQFASTSSFNDGKKIVILDEMDRMQSAQEALKALIESTSSNCRFIITTNNLSKIIDPIKSRTQLIDFNFSSKDSQSLMVNYFKRICWILDQEKIKFDKKVLAEFVQKLYPDFRKTLNELQKYTKMHTEINSTIFASINDSMLTNLVAELKAKKFNNIRKMAIELDPSTFYEDFYREIDQYVADQSKPEVIQILRESAYQSAFTSCKELELVGCLISLMSKIVWR